MTAGYRVLTPDRPGYLGTPIVNGGTPERQADLAAALLDTLGIDRVAVVGLSAGGPGAIQFAVRHADRVDVVGSRHDGDIGYANSVNSHEKIHGSTLITVDQFGHLIWWGDARVTRDFQRAIEAFLDRHTRRS